MASTVAIPYAAPQAAPASRTKRRSVAALRFTDAPALLPACAFALGIALAGLRWIPPGWLVVGIAGLGAAALTAAFRAQRVLLPSLAVLFLALGSLAAELEPPVDPQHALALLAAEEAPSTFTGEVVRVEPVKQTTYTAFFGHKKREEVSRRVDLRLRSYADRGEAARPLAGGLRLTVYTDADVPLPALRCGTVLAAVLAPRSESRYNDPGVWDAREYLRGQGVGALGSVDAKGAQVLGRAPPRFSCLLHQWQAEASERVLGLAALPSARHLPPFLRLSEQDASMLTAMLTGDRSYLQKRTRVGFERTGSFHLLVVSGMHLAIFSGAVFLLARRLRMPRVAATMCTLALSFAYAVFTGFGEPVQRSFWMVALYLVGRLLFRERHALQALGLASLLLTAASPRALGGSSLQMTLLTVVAIGGIAAPLAERSFAPYLHGARDLWLAALDPALPPRVAQWRIGWRLVGRRFENWFGQAPVRKALPFALALALRAVELLLVSALVELVMALPMAVYFHRVTVLGLPVNFLIIPFLGFLLPAAMVCFLCLLVAPSLAVVPAAVTAALLHLVSAIVDGFAGLDFGDFRLPAPPAPRMAAWLLLIALSVYLLRRAERWTASTGLACLLAAFLLAVAPQPVRYHPGKLLVAAIDVGQGDAILVISPDGKTMLVDAGGLVGAPPGSSFDIGEEVVSPALWARGIRRLDAVAISHAHLDHIGGVPAVLANFHPRVLLVGNNPRSANYAAILAQAASLGVPVEEHRAGDRWRLGREINVEALWPSRAYVPKEEPGNNDSLVLRLAYRRSSALLEGDAQALAEAGMVAAGLPHADLLKVGHHGSLSSSTPAFLAALSPRWGAVSCGRRNFYGHPKLATLERLEADHIRTLRTDLVGEADFMLDGAGMVASAWSAMPP